jgi:hypothetical protein
MPHVIAECVRRLVVHQPVRVAMRGDLMPVGDDSPDEPGMALADPPEHEERRRHLRVVEDAQHAIGVGLDAALEAGPAAPRDHPVEGTHVKVILHVDGHGVDDAVLADDGSAAAPWVSHDHTPCPWMTRFTVRSSV